MAVVRVESRVTVRGGDVVRFRLFPERLSRIDPESRSALE